MKIQCTDVQAGGGGKKTVKESIGCMRDAPSAPFFVPRTNNGRLIRELKSIEELMNRVGKYKVKMVEEGGLTLLSALSSKNPLGEKLCQRVDCQVCRYQESKVRCQICSVVYTYTCVMCERGRLDVKYWGETSSSIYIRAKDGWLI